MKNDLIEEIRKVRCSISERFPDINSFIKHYQELDQKYADRLLTTPYEIKKEEKAGSINSCYLKPKSG